ncbi:MAG: Rieske 2Fe-2S domain-containing protein [Gammaproteobacteria bacterium]|nr:Rieske 2Fe-2S domain-containing protein [Gammaproteobacteria bacterium]
MGIGLDLPIPFGWFAVAYSNELAAGEVKPTFLFDQHQALFRTESGEARMLEAFCPHLGAHLGHGGKVMGDRIACPFHGWQLDGDGTVQEVPYADAKPRRVQEGECLYSYPVQERNQMIWAWYHPRRVAPTFEIDDIPEFSDPDWTELETYEWEIESHIQETGENAVDIAHFVYVHSAREMPKAKITLDGSRRVTELVSLSPKINNDGTFDLSQTEESHLHSRNWGPGMSSQSFDRAFKVVMMGTMTPVTNNRLILRFAFTMPRRISEQFKALADGVVAEIVRQVGHDMVIWKHKLYRDDPILCDGDGPVAKYRQWFRQFYDEGAENAPVRLVG